MGGGSNEQVPIATFPELRAVSVSRRDGVCVFQLAGAAASSLETASSRRGRIQELMGS